MVRSPANRDGPATGGATTLSIHPLRTADALQLAAALIWAQESPQGLEFVCLDQNLREAAPREGFSILP